MLPSNAGTRLLWLAATILLPSTALATTITIASPITAGSTPPIDLTTYGSNTATFINGAYTLYWKAHLNESTPYLELALDVMTKGWFGLGFADPASGGMTGSDIATITVVPNATHYVTSLTDRYALIHALPNEDDINNFNLTSGWQSADQNRTIVVFTRPLDTKDSQDRIISAGTTNIVMAYSVDGTSTVAYHGPNNQASVVQFFADTSVPTTNTNETVYTWNYTNPATPITTNETRYVCTSFLFSPPNLPDGSTPSGQIIEIAPLIDPATTNWVHHYLVYGCQNNTKFQSMFGNPTECLTNGNFIDDICPEMVFGWAVGSQALTFPPDVGATFGDPTDPYSIKYLTIQIHYNNPSMQVVNITDQSGLSFKYVTSKRKYNSGTIQLGDPNIAADPMSFGPSSLVQEFTCPGECTSLWPNDITIFGSFLHAHAYGTQLVSTVTSNQTTTELGRADFFEFPFQHIEMTNHVVKRGDRINVHCNFDLSQNLFSSLPSHANDQAVTFGLGSENEMCLNYVYYYPRFDNAIEFGTCGNAANHKTICGFNDKGLINLDITNPVQPGSSYADPSWVLTRRFGLNASGVAALNQAMTSTPTASANQTATSSPSAATRVVSRGVVGLVTFWVIMALL